MEEIVWKIVKYIVIFIVIVYICCILEFGSVFINIILYNFNKSFDDKVEVFLFNYKVVMGWVVFLKIFLLKF